MNIIKYFRCLTYACSASCFMTLLWYLKGVEIKVISFIFSFIFSLIYVHWVIVRLPLFNRYYIRNKKHYNLLIHPRVQANIQTEKAGGVLAGIITALSLGLFLYIWGASNIAVNAFVSGIAACFISQAYAPE